MRDFFKTHQTVAQTLRYAGFNAICVENKNEKQPYEVVVKNFIGNQNELISMVWDMFKCNQINIIFK